MRRDIFIDNNVAKNFSNPLDPHYKGLVKWLFEFDETNPPANAHLAVSKKLLAEYSRTSGQSPSGTNIVVIVGTMQRQGRLFTVSNSQIREFKRQYFTKRVVRNMQCNAEDRDHIPVVLLSDRKYAISRDRKFVQDLVAFPGFSVRVVGRPQDIAYKV